MISIDIAAQKLDLGVSEAELAARKKTWQAPKTRVSKGYLYLYAQLAQSAAQGAIIKTRADEGSRLAKGAQAPTE